MSDERSSKNSPIDPDAIECAVCGFFRGAHATWCRKSEVGSMGNVSNRPGTHREASGESAPIQGTADALSSNLVAELRKGTFDEYSGDEDLKLKAADEIERLTRELQGTKDELYSVDKAAKELGAEVDRLYRLRNELQDERARLRAALRDVGALLVAQRYIEAAHLVELAKGAADLSPVDSQTGAELNRAASETDARQDQQSVMEYEDTSVQDDSK